MNKLDRLMQKQWRTRDGRLARIVSVNASVKRPVIALVSEGYSGECAYYYTENLRIFAGTIHDDLDLIEVMPRNLVWLNIYSKGLSSWKTMEDADATAVPDRVARICLDLNEIKGRFDTSPSKIVDGDAS